MKPIRTIVQSLMEQEQIYSLEGRRGVSNLAKLVEMLGYKDPQHFGQLSNGSSIGSIIMFLEDNSGALEQLVNWIGEQKSTEWGDALRAQLNDAQGGDPNEAHS